jgi:hypothetical protein
MELPYDYYVKSYISCLKRFIAIISPGDDKGTVKTIAEGGMVGLTVNFERAMMEPER